LITLYAQKVANFKHEKIDMRKILIFLSTLLVGCCHSKVTTPSVTASDSTVVKVVHKVEHVTDTVYVEIPKIVEKVKRDTMSHLENDYAYSDAIVKGDNLYHTLATKPQKKAVAVETKIEYRDSIVEKIVEKEIVNTIEVERPDTWWEQTQKKGFNAMLIALALVILLKYISRKLL
jgi:hypothetical protein